MNAIDNSIKCINGELKVGDIVISIPEDDYPCLVGTVLSIEDYVYVNFMDSGYSENRLQEIEDMLVEAYGRPTTPGIWPLNIDNLPMSPDSLICITGISDYLKKAILDSREATEALCDLVQNSPAIVSKAHLPKQTEYISEKLYSPLKFYLRDNEDVENGVYDDIHSLKFYLRDNEYVKNGVYDDIHYWRDDLSHKGALDYINNIEAEFSRDSQSYNSERGLAEYITDSLDDTIISLFPKIELHGGKLWCVADIKASRPISPAEMGELVQWWEGQLSDGWGESFSQGEIKVKDGELYLETWTPDNVFFVDTQKEFEGRLGLEVNKEKPTLVENSQQNEPQKEKPLNEHSVINTLRKAKDQKTQENKTLDQLLVQTGDSVDSVDKEWLVQSTQLTTRLEKNLSDYHKSLKELKKIDIIHNATKIAATNEVFEYLKERHMFSKNEIEYLLKFENPLEIVRDNWPKTADFIDASVILHDICNKKQSNREPMDKNSNSVLAKLKDAANKLKEPQNDKNLNKIHNRNYPEI